MSKGKIRTLIFLRGKEHEMERLNIPKGYKSPQSIKDTEIFIKEVKDYFERALAKELNLTRVSAPLFVRPESGLNDNLNGVERPVTFGIKEHRHDGHTKGRGYRQPSFAVCGSVGLGAYNRQGREK